MHTFARLRKPKALLAAACGGLLGAALLAPTAASAESPIIEHDHFNTTDTHIEQEAHGEDWCPDVPFLVEWSGHNVFGFLGMHRGTEGLLYGADHGSFHETYTNVENGRTMTIRQVWHGGDIRVVDNGDGTLSIRGGFQVSSALVDPDGAIVEQGAGRVEFIVLIDHNGTPDDWDDDEEISFTITRISGNPFFYYDDRDVCQDILDLLG